MAVKIRLRRTGKRNAPCHRIVVTDGRNPRDGRFIENIGVYDPRRKTERVDLARADYWISCGAQPSDTVSAIIKRARAGIPMGKVKETGAEPEPAAEEAPADTTASAEADIAESAETAEEVAEETPEPEEAETDEDAAAASDGESDESEAEPKD